MLILGQNLRVYFRLDVSVFYMRIYKFLNFSGDNIRKNSLLNRTFINFVPKYIFFGS